MKFTRRELLRLAAGAASARLLHGSAEPAIRIIPPASASGIEFRSRERHVRASATCPRPWVRRCAFLDYDNDGWMDIYLVNSGPCDFFNPPKPLRNALYKNNRDGTFTDVTEKAGVAGGTFGMGVAVGDYDNDGWPDLFVTAYGKLHPLPQQPRRHVHRCQREGRARDARAGPPAPSGSTTTTTAGWICSSAASSITAPAAPLRLRRQQAGQALLLHSARFQAHRQLSVPQQRRRHVHRSQPAPTSERSLGKGLGVVATDINNDGRMDLFVANDTVQNFLFVNRGPDANGKWKWEEIALAAEVGYSDNGQARSGMGVDAADSQRRRLAGSVRRQRRSGDVLALQQQQGRDVSRRRARATASRRRRGC